MATLILLRFRRESDIARFSRHAEIMDSSKLCTRWRWPLETCDLVGWGWSCNVTAIYQRLQTRFTRLRTGSERYVNTLISRYSGCLLKWFRHGHFELNLKGHGLNFHVLESSSQTFAVFWTKQTAWIFHFPRLCPKKPRVLCVLNMLCLH